MQMNLREETRHFNKNSRHFKWFWDSHKHRRRGEFTTTYFLASLILFDYSIQTKLIYVNGTGKTDLLFTLRFTLVGINARKGICISEHARNLKYWTNFNFSQTFQDDQIFWDVCFLHASKVIKGCNVCSNNIKTNSSECLYKNNDWGIDTSSGWTPCHVLSLNSTGK